MATKIFDRAAQEELVVWRSAKRIIKRRGVGALDIARGARDTLAFEGDENGARTWRKTAQAVEWLLRHPESMDLIDQRA